MTRKNNSNCEEPISKQSGAIYALSAYATWGFVPLFWRELRMVPPLQILAHRIVWSVVFFAFIFALRSTLQNWLTLLKNPAILNKCIPSALAIGVNWGLYIFAVNSGHALESSLGYFINPIFNVLIGSLLFREKLNRLQWSAFACACAGVCWLTLTSGRLPWIALALAGSFTLYGVIRKKTALNGNFGTAVESLLLLPVAAVLLLHPHFAPVNVLDLANPLYHLGLLSLGGALTALPLVWFSEAAQRLPLSTLGFFQYISPTFQFLIAVFIFREPFGHEQLLAFILIWTGLLIFGFDAGRSHIYERKRLSSSST
ncbi:EamA family transporter RarD [bacterium]|nr:EamA family transporter RarD [bacterium]